MPRPHTNMQAPGSDLVSNKPHIRYLVVRQQDVWFIKYEDEEYGPYRSEREAMLFAIDAAHKLGEQGDETQVLKLDEIGEARPVWTYGLDPYPPDL
jgi:hypothetical protein